MPREFVRRRTSTPRPLWVSVLLGLLVGAVAILLIVALF